MQREKRYDMKYAIIGTGAIGGYYGGKLAKAGNEVHFLLHTDYEYVKENGLQVDSCDGSFHLDQVNAYQTTADIPPCDVILVCLKSTNEHLLRNLLPPMLHENTVVVLIQNGIGLESDLQDLFPTLQIVAGLYFIVKRFGLTNPIFEETASYGHFGRQPETSKVEVYYEDKNTFREGEHIYKNVEFFGWEKLDLVNQLKTAFGC